jgi:hypothetical protein
VRERCARGAREVRESSTSIAGDCLPAGAGNHRLSGRLPTPLPARKRTRPAQRSAVLLDYADSPRQRARRIPAGHPRAGAAECRGTGATPRVPHLRGGRAIADARRRGVAPTVQRGVDLGHAGLRAMGRPRRAVCRGHHGGGGRRFQGGGQGVVVRTPADGPEAELRNAVEVEHERLAGVDEAAAAAGSRPVRCPSLSPRRGSPRCWRWPNSRSRLTRSDARRCAAGSGRSAVPTGAACAARSGSGPSVSSSGCAEPTRRPPTTW